MTSTTVATAYLAAFYRGDRDATRALLHDNFDFDGPFVQLRDADAFLDSAHPLLAIATGSSVRQVWTDGEDVCVIHDVGLRKGDVTDVVTMADWLTVRDDRVASERVLFDAARLRAVLTA